MKPIKLKDLLEQAKDPETQCIEIMEDYTLSAKTVFEGIVKDVPENMLGKYYISDWYPEEGTPVLVVLVWVNPHEEFNKYAENSNSDSHRITMLSMKLVLIPAMSELPGIRQTSFWMDTPSPLPMPKTAPLKSMLLTERAPTPHISTMTASGSFQTKALPL